MFERLKILLGIDLPNPNINQSMNWINLNDSVPKRYESLQIIFLLQDGTMCIATPSKDDGSSWIVGWGSCEKCVNVPRVVLSAELINNFEKSRLATHWMSVPQLPLDGVVWQ